MKVIVLICIPLLIACSQKKSTETTAESTALTKDTIIQTVSQEEQPSSSVKESTQEYKGKNLSLEELDTVFQNAFSKFHDVNLSPIIHPQFSAYWIADGAGVYPSVKEIKTKQVLFDCNAYSLFTNLPMMLNGYFVNPEGLNNCPPQTEGIFIYDAKDTQLIYKAYQSQLTATGETMSDADAQRLHKLDATISKYVLINEPSKSGELNTFEMYFSLIDGKLYLAAVDTRSCGI